MSRGKRSRMARSRTEILDAIAGKTLRLADRVLPLSVFRALLWPGAAAFGAYQLLYRGPTYRAFRKLPRSLRPEERRLRWGLRLWSGRTAMLMSKLVRFWPDRLREPRWRKQCRFLGAERLDAARSAGRPVILAALHYGNLNELGHWLRARGVVSAILSGDDPARISTYRERLGLHRDAAFGMEGLPRILRVDQLWDVRDFLNGPNRALIVTVDAEHKTRILVRGDGYNLRIATGMLRLAAIVNAVVIPCAVRSPRGLTFEVILGSPVPDSEIITNPDPMAASVHIVREILSVIAAYPEQCDPYFLHHGLVNDPEPPRSI